MKRFLHLSFIISFMAFIFLSLVPFTYAQLRGKALYERLTEDEDLIKFKGISKFHWTPDGKAIYVYKEGTFQKIHILTGKKSPLFDHKALISAYNEITHKNLDKLPFKDFTFMDEGQKIRFKVQTKGYIYDQNTQKMISYVPKKKVRGVRGRVYTEVFSPNLKYRAYTRDYNLYIRDMEGKETPLTTNGHKELRNGFPDWVYPEELSQYKAFWWSPDSQKIAFMQFDEHPVVKYPIVHDTDPNPQMEMQSYPKAGTNNPIVNLFIVDIQSQKITRIETGTESNVYFLRGKWTPDSKEFTFQKMNRLQNQIELWAADPETGKVRHILKDEDKCYIQADFDLTFLKNSPRFLWTSERSGWNEIYLYDLKGNLVKQITHQKLPVLSLVDVDEENGWIYFTGAENRGMEFHFYRVKMDGSEFTRLTQKPGSHRISLSPGTQYFADTFSSFETPKKITLHTANGEFIRELGHSVVSEEFQNFQLIKPEHFVFKSAEGNYNLDGLLYKPAHFDPHNEYPLILSVYGGPGSKMIRNRFIMDDRRQALSQLGFIVLSIDHRGVSRRGKKFQNLMYMNLGEIELADHTAAVKHIGERTYVDQNRVGITGHSYGGYLTCIALLKAPEMFDVGVAGAPVTDWRNYDTIYTERYMRRPQDNPEGYKKSSCMNYAENLKGHLYIHHGCVDNNVHPGNTIQLIQALLKHNKKFDLMLYPEQRHGIRFERYPEARVEYFIEHLNPEVK
ncbi:S9 family peptidase [bacterium]|nr:S9 family peptidase [bacterium]